MKCMRCGVETLGKQVFCDECLASMEKYPVKPGTAVHLPLREQTDDKKNPRKRRESSLEEQLLRSKQLIRKLWLGLAAALLAAAVLGALLYLEITESQTNLPQGKNYTTTQGA